MSSTTTNRFVQYQQNLIDSGTHHVVALTSAPTLTTIPPILLAKVLQHCLPPCTPNLLDRLRTTSSIIKTTCAPCPAPRWLTLCKLINDVGRHVWLGGDISHVYLNSWSPLPPTLLPAVPDLRFLAITLDLRRGMRELGQKFVPSALCAKIRLLVQHMNVAILAVRVWHGKGSLAPVAEILMNAFAGLKVQKAVTVVSVINMEDGVDRDRNVPGLLSEAYLRNWMGALLGMFFFLFTLLFLVLFPLLPPLVLSPFFLSYPFPCPLLSSASLPYPHRFLSLLLFLVHPTLPLLLHLNAHPSRPYTLPFASSPPLHPLLTNPPSPSKHTQLTRPPPNLAPSSSPKPHTVNLDETGPGSSIPVWRGCAAAREGTGIEWLLGMSCGGPNLAAEVTGAGDDGSGTSDAGEQGQATTSVAGAVAQHDGSSGSDTCSGAIFVGGDPFTGDAGAAGSASGAVAEAGRDAAVDGHSGEHDSGSNAVDGKKQTKKKRNKGNKKRKANNREKTKVDAVHQPKDDLDGDGGDLMVSNKS